MPIATWSATQAPPNISEESIAAAAAFVAAHYDEEGYTILATAQQTTQGLLPLAARRNGHFVLPSLRIAEYGAEFAPPIGAYEHDTPSALRALLTSWFTDIGQIPPPLPLRLDAVGVYLDRDGAPVDLDIVQSAY